MDKSPKVQLLETAIVNGRAVHKCPTTGTQFTACTPIRNFNPKSAHHSLKPISAIKKTKRVNKATPTNELSPRVQKIQRELDSYTKAVNHRNKATLEAIKRGKEIERESGIVLPPRPTKQALKEASTLCRAKRLYEHYDNPVPTALRRKFGKEVFFYNPEDFFLNKYYPRNSQAGKPLQAKWPTPPSSASRNLERTTTAHGVHT